MVANPIRLQRSGLDSCVSLSCRVSVIARDGGTLTDEAEATYAGEGWRTIGGAGQRQREAARHGSNSGGSKL